ncbi:type II secretion system protein GspG [Archangium gephyra]|uniref:type II secretion system protein GspG n=1 Tax=Archangium gephyra TaxID=48 RepID=UPI0035D5252D
MSHAHRKLHWKAALRALLLAASFLAVAAMLWLAPLLLIGHVCLPTKPEVAERDLSALQSALKLFHKRHQRYPSTGEGLQHLVDLHDLERLPRDPWGLPYGYALQEGLPVVWSYGADGAPGGEGPDADISSRAPASHQ